MSEPRLPARQSRAIVYLFVFAVLIAAAALFWQAHSTNANQAEQRRQGLLIERRLCADIGTMAAIPPPAGPASTNPSRAYEQAEHRAWSGLVADIGCKGVEK